MQLEAETAMLDLNLKKLRDGDLHTKILSLKTISFQLSGEKIIPMNLVDLILTHLDKPLLTENSQLPIVATTLVEQLFNHCTNNNQAFINQKLLRIIIRNLGNQNMQLRKLSHRCLVEYIRRFSNFDSIFTGYLTESLENQSANTQLKQKSINSLQSILILQYKSLNIKSPITKQILEVLINIGNQHDNKEVKKAAIHCIITLSKIPGFKQLLKHLSKESSKKLTDIQNDNVELHEILAQQIRIPILQIQTDRKNDYSENGKLFQTPVNDIKRNIKTILSQPNNYRLGQKSDEKKPLSKSIKMFSSSSADIAQAEQMLKLIQLCKQDSLALSQIEAYLPVLDINFNDKRVQLFNISVRTIQAILEIKIAESRFYVKLVPSVVERLNDQKFTIRNTIIKLIKQYIQNYTFIWVENLFDYLKNTLSITYKQNIINMLIYGYQSFKNIEFDQKTALAILSKEVQDKRKSLMNKALHCIALIIQNCKTSSNQNYDYQLIKTLIPEEIVGQVIIRIGDYRRSKRPSKTQPSVILEDPLQQTFKSNQVRIGTTIEKPEETNLSNYNSYKNAESLYKHHYSKDDETLMFARQSISQTSDAFRKMKTESSKEKLKQSIKVRNISVSSPKRKSNGNTSFGSNYSIQLNGQLGESQMQNNEVNEVKPLSNPVKQSIHLAEKLRDKSWKTQYLAVNTMRSLAAYHQQNLWQILGETLDQLLKGVMSLRSSISKNCLICLDEIVGKFKKRMQPFLDNIINTLLKKIVYANEFLHQQVRKCLKTITQHMSDSKLVHAIYENRQNKSSNVKISILFLTQVLVKNQKLYKKQICYFWNLLLMYAEQSSFQVRDQAKRIIYYLMDLYPNWKLDLVKNQKGFQTSDVQKISQLEKRGSLDKKSPSKTPPKGSDQYQNYNQKVHVLTEHNRIQDLERACSNFKDWKFRIVAIKELFKQIQKNPKQFCESSNCNKYVNILFQHLEDPNPKVVSNALSILDNILQPFKVLIQERLNRILSSLLACMSSIRLQVYNRSQEVYSNLKRSIDESKIIKQLAKLLSHPNQKIKMKASRELSQILPSHQIKQNINGNIEKVLHKVILQQRNIQVQGSVKGLLQIIK